MDLIPSTLSDPPTKMQCASKCRLWASAHHRRTGPVRRLQKTHLEWSEIAARQPHRPHHLLPQTRPPEWLAITLRRPHRPHYLPPQTCQPEWLEITARQPPSLQPRTQQPAYLGLEDRSANLA
jgi:hypothetical protein